MTWGAAIEGTARDLLGAADVTPDDDGGQGSDAVDFLESLLSDGPVAVKQIRSDATGAGFAWITIERAKKKIGAKAQKDGMQGGWRWCLNVEDHQRPSKTFTQKSEGLRGKMTVFGVGVPDHTEPESPADDAVEVF